MYSLNDESAGTYILIQANPSCYLSSDRKTWLVPSSLDLNETIFLMKSSVGAPISVSVL